MRDPVDCRFCVGSVQVSDQPICLVFLLNKVRDFGHRQRVALLQVDRVFDRTHSLGFQLGFDLLQDLGRNNFTRNVRYLLFVCASVTAV